MAVTITYDQAGAARRRQQESQFERTMAAARRREAQQSGQWRQMFEAQQERFGAQQGRADQAQANWQAQFDAQSDKFNQAQQNWEAQFGLQQEQWDAEQAAKGLEIPKTEPTIVLDAQGQPTLREVDSPASMAYAERVELLRGQFGGLDDLTELSAKVGELGSEFTGPETPRLRGLINNARIRYAQAKGLGALQEADLELVAGPVPDFTTLGANVSGLLRNIPNPATGVDALLGLVTGKEGGLLGLTPADQITGFQQAYRVASDEIAKDIVAKIQTNPLVVDQLTDAELRKIDPAILQPVMPYLQARGRNPYASN